jgi:hypothetical protein
VSAATSATHVFSASSLLVMMLLTPDLSTRAPTLKEDHSRQSFAVAFVCEENATTKDALKLLLSS